MLFDLQAERPDWSDMLKNDILILENDVVGKYCDVDRGTPSIIAECDELLERFETDDYRNFVSCITERVAEKAGPDYQVSGRRILKNNSVTLDSVTILQNGRVVSPSFYLDDYYDAYREGMPSDVIADRILDQYRSCMKDVDDDVVGDFSFDAMKNRIVFKLINYEMNKQLLEDTPHIRYLDLAVIFCCLVKVDKCGMGTIRITNEHCRSWGVGVEELKRCAFENVPYIMPFSFKNIFCLLAEILLDETDLSSGTAHDREVIKDIIQSLESDQSRRKGNSIYVLTTPNRINGAACLLYDGLLEQIKERLGSGFFILPSSVHEVIIVPDCEENGRAIFENMVPEVNREQVPVCDILSDRVYHYPEDDFRI